jgi:glycosyltransferase involved in cell wall biosynthesis
MKQNSQNEQHVVVLHNIVSPHISPIFKELSKYFKLTVLYCSKGEDNRNWSETPQGFRYKILPNFALKIWGKDLFTYFINPTIIKELLILKPTVVIASGWDLFAYQIAFFFCKIFSIKFILWSGSTEYEKSWKRRLSKPLVWLMIKGSNAFIVYGIKAKEYIKSLGADNKKIFISYNTTDLEKYQRLCLKYSKKRMLIRKEFFRTNKKIIIYYGQFIERKGIDLLINAYIFLKNEYPQLALMLIGKGKYQQHLQQLIRDNKLNDVIFINDPGDKEINKYYAISNLLVLPSREEVWGLVINQALACGIPVIVSDHVGAVKDLVKNNYNGFVFKSDDCLELAGAIEKIILSNDLQKKFSINAKKSVKNFFPQKTVKGIIDAIEYVN